MNGDSLAQASVACFVMMEDGCLSDLAWENIVFL